MKKVPIVIVGGGIAGMSAAHSLGRRTRPFLLLEKAERMGGVIGTREEWDCRLETGPFSFLPKAECLRGLASDWGAGDEIIEADRDAARNRYILKKKKLHPLPLTPKDFLFSSLLPPWGKLRFLLEPFAKGPPPHEETVAEFVERRAGKAFLDNVIGPFVSGVTAGEPRRLSLPAQFPLFAALEKQYGSLLKAFAKRRRENRGGAAPHGFQRGMETLPRAFEKKYAANILCNAPVVNIERRTGGFIVHFRRGGETTDTVACDDLILAAPAPAAARLLEPLNKIIARELSSIYYAPMVLLHALYLKSRIAHPLNGFGFLSAADQKHPLLGSIWASSVFAERAPGGETLLQFYFGGARHPGVLNWQERDFLALTQKTAASVLKIDGPPKRYRIQKIPKAIPQYFPGHQDRIELIRKEAAKTRGLHLTGNYFEGASMDETASHAQKTVENLLA